MRPPDLAGIRARVLLIRGRYNRMVPFEVSIAILNHIADSASCFSTAKEPLLPSTRGRGLLIGHNGSGGRDGKAGRHRRDRHHGHGDDAQSRQGWVSRLAKASYTPR